MLDIQKLKQLREETGISFALCKKALEETKNDIEKAKKLLSRWGAEKVKDKAGRPTRAGGLFSYVHHNRKVASLVEILCETDFVANNRDFLLLGSELAKQIAFGDPRSLSEFLKQDYIRDTSKKIDQVMKEAVLKFGENIVIEKFVRWELSTK